MIKKLSVVGITLAACSAVIFIGHALPSHFLAADAAIATAPTVQTTPASDVAGTSALLHAIVDNNGGANGHMWFEYGTNPHAATYELSWPNKVGTQSIWGTNSMNIAVFLTGLKPNTTYYFHVKAENDSGTVTGAVQSFTTTAGTQALACANGTTLTRDEARAAMFAKKITTVFSINGTTHQAQATVTNNTDCTLPASMASWQMFDKTLATQKRFNATAVSTIAPHQSKTFLVTLPVCMAQVDTFYGAAPTALFDNNSQNDSALGATFNLNSGTSYFDAVGPFCSATPLTASLKIVKTVVNDNGGTKTVSDFALFQNTTRVNSGEVKTYTFSTSNGNWPVTVSETNLPGYTAGSWGGDCSSDGKVTLHPGEHKTCTITNNDNPPTTQYGCIAIHKEAYDVNNNRITPTPVFTFTVDNNTITTDTNGNALINSVPVGDHTVNEVVPSGWTLTSIVSANQTNTINVGVGSGCADITFKNKQVSTTQNFSATCVASSNPAYVNDTITYTAIPVGGNGSYTYSWTGDESLSGNATTTSKQYGSTGTKNAHVVVSSNGQTVTADCATVINNHTGGGGGGFSLSCAANPNSNVSYGAPVTFTAYPINGSGSYTYSWTGDDGLSGNGASVTHSYNSSGVKNATISLTMNGQVYTASCTTVVNVTTVGGCYNNCGGGGYNPPPTVTVTRENGGGQVAGVFLSQVPYTGIGSNFKIALFMLALFTWSAWISYLIIKRKARKNGVTVAQVFQGATPSTLAFANAGTNTIDPRVTELGNIKAKAQGTIPVMTAIPRAEINTVPHEPKKAEAVRSPFLEHMQSATSVAPAVAEPTPAPEAKSVSASVTRPSVAAAAPKFEPAMTTIQKPDTQTLAQIPKPQAQIVLPSRTEDIMETLENRARELHTLISADGLEIIAKAAQSNKHNATIILNHLVELYRGSEHEVEGDWMVLNGEKIGKILFSTYMTMTPVFIGWLAHGDEKKTMAFVRMIQMQGQTIKDFVMNIVIELDKAYRFRVENMGDADATILDATMQWSNEELEQVIHTLVTAVDQTYSSVYSSVKIALVKVLDLAKSKHYN